MNKARRTNGRRKPSAKSTLHMLRIFGPKNPNNVLYDLDERFAEVLKDLHEVVMDKTVRVSKRDAALALRLLLTDETGVTEFVTPALLKIAQRYIRTSIEIVR